MITAPFSIDVTNKNDNDERQLHLQFTQEFRAMPADHRSVIFKKYVEDLHDMLMKMEDDNAEKAGILTLHQISSELLPHIVQDEIPVSETMVIELAQDAVFNHVN